MTFLILMLFVWSMLMLMEFRDIYNMLYAPCRHLIQSISRTFH